MNQPPYDPNDPYAAYPEDEQQPDQLPGGFVRAEPAGKPKKTKVGDKYKVTGKAKYSGSKKQNPWTSVGIWIVGLGLPVLLVLFGVKKLFLDDGVVMSNPMEAVELSKEQTAELEKMGVEIAQQLTEGRKSELIKLTAWEAVSYRLTRGMKLSTSQSIKIRDAINAQWPADIPGVFRQILGSDLERVPAQFVKVRKRDGYASALIRSMPSDKRIMYYDIMVVPVEGKLKIVDIWDCNLAMYASEAVRREVILEIPTNEGVNTPWRAVFGDDLSKENILAIKTLLGHDVLNRVQALDDIAVLPEPIRKQREFYSMGIHASIKSLDEGVTLDQLEAFRKLLATPPAGEEGSVVTGTLLAEIERRAGNAAAIEANLLKAHKEIGGDAFLKVVVGQDRLARGDAPGAEAMAAEATKEDRKVPELFSFKAALEAKK